MALVFYSLEIQRPLFPSLSLVLYNSQSKHQTLVLNSIACRSTSTISRSSSKSLQITICHERNTIVCMSNRSNNRRPIQRGRNLSIEAIQAVQSLKRAKNDSDLLDLAFNSKVSRLIKSDLISVLRELIRQNQGTLALQVFEETRKEYWYKPQLTLYADLVSVLANNGLLEKVHLLFSYLRKEYLEADTEGFNALLKNLMEFGFYQLAMECFYLMKDIRCEPDESTFRILILGFESKGLTDLSVIVREEAEKYFGDSLEFLEEEVVLTQQ